MNPHSTPDPPTFKSWSALARSTVTHLVSSQTRTASRPRDSGSFRYTIGSYSKVPVSRGYKEHDLAPPLGLFFTDAELRAIRNDEKKEMSQELVQGMMDDQTDAEEMEELAQDLRVKFTLPAQVRKEKPSRHHQTDSTKALRKAMAAGSLEPKQKKATEIPAIWFGMVQEASGLR